MTITKRGVFTVLVFVIPLAAFAPLAGSAGPSLGSAHRLAVPNASTVTNTGPKMRNGGTGVSPGPKISGFFGAADNDSTGKVTGTIHEFDAVAAQAQTYALIAANSLAGLPFTSNITGQHRGGLAPTPGGYFFSSSAQLAWAAALDAHDKANADAVYHVGRALDAASDSTIGMVNGDGDAGDRVDLDDGTNRLFAEHLLADRGILLDTLARRILCGRAMAPKASLKLDTNAISDDCTAINGEGSGPTEFANLGAKNYNVPEPSTGLLLLAVSLIGVGPRMKAALRASSESV